MPANLKAMIRVIITDTNLHARWLNTFSYLEYIGFRKIVKSQEAHSLNTETLGHAIEEGRHAYLLKKLAVRTGGSGFDNYSYESMLCGSEAESYFQTLDRSCESHFGHVTDPTERAQLVYLYVTWLVEVRALSVYGTYQEALVEIGIRPLLDGLLAEEDKHLEAVEKRLLEFDVNFISRGQQLKAVEEKLYQDYLLALSRTIPNQEVHVGNPSV